MGKAVEHLLMYLLAVCISSKDYPIHLPIYWGDCLFFWSLVFWAICIWRILIFYLLTG
jgi:hypothetical protein